MNHSQILATYNPRVTPVIEQQNTQGFPEHALALEKNVANKPSQTSIYNGFAQSFTSRFPNTSMEKR